MACARSRPRPPSCKNRHNGKYNGMAYLSRDDTSTSECTRALADRHPCPTPCKNMHSIKRESMAVLHETVSPSVSMHDRKRLRGIMNKYAPPRANARDRKRQCLTCGANRCRRPKRSPQRSPTSSLATSPLFLNYHASFTCLKIPRSFIH